MLYRAVGKRAMDVGIASLVLIVTLPVWAIIAGALQFTMGSPVLFTQRRGGLGGRPFRIYKFRTMTDARDSSGRLLPDADRLTSIGRWLRNTTLDELPEVLNVIKGDMSIVGPRPLLVEYENVYTPHEWKRMSVRPGLTGWAVVHGRNSLSWDERLALDVWYAENVSLTLDVRIILRTVTLVLRGRGVSAAGHTTMPRLDEERGARAAGDDH